MKIIYSVDDLPRLHMAYVVQLFDHEHIENIFDTKTSGSEGFWLEKRVRLITARKDNCQIHAIYYDITKKPVTALELVSLLNGHEGRYYRLLNKKERLYLDNWFSERRGEV